MIKTWKTINETLNRSKRVPTSHLYFIIMVLHYPAQKISQMDSMFTLLILEKNHASEIEQNVNDIIDYTQYLSTPITETRLQFKCNTDDTQKAIDRLENKTSSEHDGISNKLLKLLKSDVD